MKSVHTILSHLTSQPQFRFLKRQECYQKYMKLLGNKYQSAIAFVYVKHETLYIALTHPGFKMELNYNKDLLKELLGQLARYDQNCSMLKAEKVVIFHSKYHPVTPEVSPSTVPYYREMATGEFEIETEDEALREAYEQIQDLIKENG